MKALSYSLKPKKKFRTGKTIFENSLKPHTEWLEKLSALDSVEIILNERDPFQILSDRREPVALIIDDLGALHFNEKPLALLGLYYDCLAFDGEAWLRFPKSFWVFLEDQHRVSLQDYLATKFPSIAKKLKISEFDSLFIKSISGPDDWLLLKKDQSVKELFFPLSLRTQGGISRPNGLNPSPFLEFTENPLRHEKRSPNFAQIRLASPTPRSAATKK